MKGTVSRKDITLRENVEYHPATGDHLSARTIVYWTATFDGRISRISTGETLEMSREATHAGEALLLLEEALKELGLELR